MFCPTARPLNGYLNPSRLDLSEPVDLLTTEGEHRPVQLKDVRAIYFVREFNAAYEPERKAFLSRPKLDGLWVRLKFRDNETLEGVVNNDLLALLDSGVQITPPDLNGTTLRIFVPRNALSELMVLGVVGIARRKPAAPSSHSRSFSPIDISATSSVQHTSASKLPKRFPRFSIRQSPRRISFLDGQTARPGMRSHRMRLLPPLQL